MDRDEALRLLRGGPEGIAEWNRLRNAGEEIPDLRGTDLAKANLCEAKLHGARLGGANLRITNLGGADLREANLVKASLFKADLRRADLREADLYRVDLHEANLGGARLSRADLREANLGGADLSRADLRGAHLGGAQLDGASLSGADLFGAIIYMANLEGANLHKANLVRAILSKAVLVKADLREAYLGGANFRKADLREAGLFGAWCGETQFDGVDLSEVKGLDSIRHRGPSHVSTDTLIRSMGKIPKAFLRGCGVPDTLIDHLSPLVGALEPIQFYSCFISYSTKDEEFAQHLHSRMRDKGLRVWFAPEDMKAGRYHDEQIERAIQVHDKLLLVLSEASMASEWVRREIRKARETESREDRRKLFPIRLVGVEVVQAWECVDPRTGQDYAGEVLKYHIPGFSNWKDHDSFEAGFTKLLRDLEAEQSTAK